MSNTVFIFNFIFKLMKLILPLTKYDNIRFDDFKHVHRKRKKKFWEGGNNEKLYL